MRILVIILIAIVALIALLLIVALFVKKEYAIEREIVIDKPKQEVFDYIKFLKNQDNYSKWVMMDPSMKKDFTGTDGTVGFIYAWDSTNKNAGKGAQEIKSIDNGNRLDIEIRFEKPFVGIAYVHQVTESLSENQTKVRWGMKGESTYPMNIMNLFMDSMLGKDLDESLNTLKVVLEK
jgi:hypothetical protein